jgi:hypothetical protein
MVPDKPIRVQGLAKNHAFPVEFEHVLVKQTYRLSTADQRPQIQSGYRSRFSFNIIPAVKRSRLIFEDF